jgi:hypothetical protein
MTFLTSAVCTETYNKCEAPGQRVVVCRVDLSENPSKRVGCNEGFTGVQEMVKQSKLTFALRMTLQLGPIHT